MGNKCKQSKRLCTRLLQVYNDQEKRQQVATCVHSSNAGRLMTDKVPGARCPDSMAEAWQEVLEYLTPHRAAHSQCSWPNLQGATKALFPPLSCLKS